MNQRQQEIFELVERIRPLLAGHAPDIQGAALADLCAIWLCGHPPQMRPEMLELQLRTIISLTDANDQIIFGKAGHPSTHERN